MAASKCISRVQANAAGADEALMLDPCGFVATCNSTNFFIVRKGEVSWPSCLSLLTASWLTAGLLIQNTVAGCVGPDEGFAKRDAFASINCRQLALHNASACVLACAFALRQRWWDMGRQGVRQPVKPPPQRYRIWHHPCCRCGLPQPSIRCQASRAAKSCSCAARQASRAESLTSR